VTFLSDAIGAENLPAYEASIHVNYPLIANAVLEVDEFLAAVDAAGEAAEAQVGDTVRGSDRGKIGTIEEIAAPSGDHAGYVLVKRGVVLSHDTYIPLDAIVRRAGDTVFVNVPKLVVAKMPWGSPSSAAGARAKLGPAAADVDKLYRSHTPSALRSGPLP
jgi:ureidoacrylate peracid hydrolase